MIVLLVLLYALSGVFPLLGRQQQLRNKAPFASQPAPSPWGSIATRLASL